VSDGPEVIPRPEHLATDLEAERERRQQVEGRLREVEERHDLLVEGVRDYAIVLLDPAGRISSWNEGAKRLTGYEAEEALGQPVSQLFIPEDRKAGMPERELRIAASASRSEDENWTLRKDNSRFWSSGLTTALRDRAGGLPALSRFSAT